MIIIVVGGDSFFTLSVSSYTTAPIEQTLFCPKTKFYYVLVTSE